MNDDLRVAAVIAISKYVEEYAKDVKSEERAKVREAFEESHVSAKSYISPSGKVLGKVSVTPAKGHIAISPDNYEAGMELLDRMGLIRKTPVTGWQNNFTESNGHIYRKDTGEMVDCMIWADPIPGQVSARVTGFKPDEVIPELRRVLSPAEMGNLLLGGSNE